MMKYPTAVALSGLVTITILNPSQAQMNPDLTLPNNTSIQIEGNIRVVGGGTQIGNNLFHSFKDFSVPTGSTVQFANPLGIQNIITRVTGGSLSNIDGLIKVNGTVNLFLINPNGITFGSNARLDMGGSFFASTADAIKFTEGEFSATNPQAPPLLIINVPTGLKFVNNRSEIHVNGTGQGITSPNTGYSPTVRNSEVTGLQVQSGETLALLGGEITIDGGTLAAEGGKVELASVASGVITLNSVDENWTLGYEGISKFSDITLTNQALVDASGAGTGSININGANVNTTNGSFLLIQNLGATSSGKININASDSLAITGASPDGNISSSILTEALSSGKGSDIEVSTQRLLLQDGARVGASTYGDAPGGNINVNSSDSVQLLENRYANPYRQGNIISLISASTFSSGNAGSLQLSTNYLLLTDGGTIASSTMGAGDGSNITVNANSIDVIGASIRSAPSAIAASAFNAGDAGSLLINTKKLQLTGGGVVNSAARATSNAGDVTINADSIEVTGENSNTGASRITSSVETSNETVRNIFNLPLVPTGSSGNLTITTKVLNVNQGGRVDARNEGSGDAGTLSIRANLIKLSNNGAITASTVSGNGGNIFLGAQNLQLRQNSTVSASAGNSGNGGNVTIKGGAVAVLEGSSITANAYLGRGGNIIIDGRGVFISQDGTVSATSEKGIDGSVEINGPQNDLSSPNPVPTSVNTPGETDVCAAQAKGTSGEFVNAGRGGLPQTPSDPLGSAFTWGDQTQSQENQQLAQTQPTQEIVDAQGWKTNPNGTISFTSTPSEASAHSSATNPPCLNAGDSPENVANNSQEITIQQPHKKPEE